MKSIVAKGERNLESSNFLLFTNFVFENNQLQNEKGLF